MYANSRAISTLAVILLIIFAAIVGGIISYAFTISAYVKLPEKTTLVITGFYIDKEDVNSFKISVLNPSYSPTDATIYEIALSLKGETELYYAANTDPPIEYGIVVPVGESINITCSHLRKGGFSILLGEFIGEFAGKTVIVHVFSSDSTASNMEAALPNVKLNITADFNPQISFKNFNITLTNDASSEIDLTIESIAVSNVVVEGSTPDIKAQPITVPRNSSLHISFNGSWYGLNKTTITVFTKQGYIFRKEVELQRVHVEIQNVTIAPNSKETITLNWNWDGYSGMKVAVVAYFLENFETEPFNATIPS